MERRAIERKIVDAIEVEGVTNLSDLQPLCEKGHIVDTSLKGFLLLIHRDSLGPQDLRSTLNLDSIIGSNIGVFLPQMNLDLDGIVKRTRHIGKGYFEVFIEFSVDIPEYWRECLLELMPQPGEMD